MAIQAACAKLSLTVMRNWISPAVAASAVFCAAIAAVSIGQASGYAAHLARYVLAHGRIVLSSGDFIYDRRDPRTNGDAARVLDGNPERPAILAFPSDHPHGTFLLIDTALSHWPQSTDSPDPLLPGRQPAYLQIWNGACLKCDRDRFSLYSRLKRVRVALLARRANNPDEEYIIPGARPIFEKLVELPDGPGPHIVSLTGAPTPPTSRGWPDNMSYLITRLEVLEVYPGTRFPERVAIGEVLYADRGPDGRIFEWR